MLYVLYCILNEGLGYYLQSIRYQHIQILFSLFTILEFSFFCLFYYLIVSKKSIKEITKYIWILFVFLCFVDYFFISNTKSFDSIASGIESLIILLLCIYYLFSQVKGTNNLLIYSTYNFWIIVTFLIYFSGTFFLYLMTESMMNDIHFQKLYFIINASFNILKNILLSVAMCMKINTDYQSKLKTTPELDDEFYFQRNNN